MGGARTRPTRPSLATPSTSAISLGTSRPPKGTKSSARTASAALTTGFHTELTASGEKA